MCREAANKNMNERIKQLEEIEKEKDKHHIEIELQAKKKEREKYVNGK
jgi:hypothetical protein